MHNQPKVFIIENTRNNTPSYKKDFYQYTEEDFDRIENHLNEDKQKLNILDYKLRHRPKDTEITHTVMVHFRVMKANGLSQFAFKKMFKAKRGLTSKQAV